MIFGFRRAPIIDQDTIDWEFETFEWLFQSFGGYRQFAGAELVRPTDAYFSVEKGVSGHAFAEALFEQVRRLAGMEDWPCRLAAQEAGPDPVVGEGQLLQGLGARPAGTFAVEGIELDRGAANHVVTITYDPRLLSDPTSLVATFAHELSHYLMATAPTLPPGDHELMEHATDLTAVYLGFGIFLANSSFRFVQFGDAFAAGWSTHRQGYMTERELVFALAIFAALLALPVDQVTEHLKPDLAKLYRKAARTVAEQEERVAALRMIGAA